MRNVVAQRIQRLARRTSISIAVVCGAAAPVGAATADPVEDVNAYVSRFTKKDPEGCFQRMTAQQPSLKAAKGSTPPTPVRPLRVVVAIDGSGSMNGRLGNTSKLALARQAADSFANSLPPDVATAVLVFGQQGNNTAEGKARSCAAVDVAVPLTTDRSALQAALARVQAVGWTPLATALQRAGEMFSPSDIPGEQVVYVVSDGEETCGGDPVAAARSLREGGTKAIVNIIGFGIPTQEARALQAVAQAGGGRFTNARDRSELERHLAALRESNRRFYNELRASNATSYNTLRSQNAISYARLCVSNLQAMERRGLDNRLASDERKKKITPDFAARARAALLARHQPMTARLEGYVDQTKDMADSANRAVDREAAAKR
jgi:Ca-activated chloride channel family protein